MLHYRYKSVGDMLLMALGNQSDECPEILQAHFEQMHHFVKSHLRIRCAETTKVLKELQARFKWIQLSDDSTSVAERLAAIYVPLSAKAIAPCYSRVASEEFLTQVQAHGSAHGGFDPVPEEVCLFRAVNAAITVSIVAQLAGQSFEFTEHSTKMALQNPCWLDAMCKYIDRALVSGLEYSKAVSALAAIHCAHDPDEMSSCKFNTVAWRYGTYPVVPSLLLSFRPSPKAVHLRCVDSYQANVKACENGPILDAGTAAFFEDMDAVKELQNNNASGVQSRSQPWIGQAARGPPDVPLYLTIERPPHYSQPNLCFVGRIKGSVVGSTGVRDVFRGLVRNLDEPSHRSGHTSAPSVINLRASAWVESRTKLVGPALHTFVPVQGENCWAILLVGQSIWFKGRIALHCVECTVERAGSRSVVIGYF